MHSYIETSKLFHLYEPQSKLRGIIPSAALRFRNWSFTIN